MFDIGFQELIVIFLIILLLFGGKKLPELSKSIGEAVKEFRNAMNGNPKNKETAQADKKKKA